MWKSEDVQRKIFYGNETGPKASELGKMPWVAVTGVETNLRFAFVLTGHLQQTCSLHLPEKQNKVWINCCINCNTCTHDLRRLRRQYTIKPSRAVSRVNVELVSDVSDTVSVSIIRGSCDKSCVWKDQRSEPSIQMAGRLLLMRSALVQVISYFSHDFPFHLLFTTLYYL
jgi:hypothetical protein